MPLKHHSTRPAAQLLANQSRRADIDARSLSEAHHEIGRFLAYGLADALELENYTIQHCQGPREGVRIKDEHRVSVVCLMRSGQYLADGLRDVLRQAPIFPVTPCRSSGLTEKDVRMILKASPHTIVVVDAVVNTGESLRPVLAQLAASSGARLHVLAAVAPTPTAEKLAGDFPAVTFEYLRLSENQYVGKGHTDTGDRVFGHVTPPIAQG
jgi:uracil phosphoribosyltransferase